MFDASSLLIVHREKARIPAWTDRILRKGPNLRQIDYNVAQQLRFSDHRPIYATFQCMVSVIDGALRETLSHEIYESRRAEVSSSTLNNKVVDSDDEDLIGYDSIEPGLPPASSDRGNGGSIMASPQDLRLSHRKKELRQTLDGHLTPSHHLMNRTG